MSLTCGFFNSIDGDRKYNADQMSSLFEGIISDGVFSNVGECFTAKFNVETIDKEEYITDGKIKIGTGRSWFNRTWTNNDSDLELDVIENTSDISKWEYIVLTVNKLDRTNDIAITDEEVPEDTETVFNHILYKFQVEPSGVKVKVKNITCFIGTETVPFITALLETNSIEEFLNNLDNQFNTWFEDVKETLVDDAAFILNEKIESINDRLTADDGNKFQFSYDEDSHSYGFKDGADTFYPFLQSVSSNPADWSIVKMTALTPEAGIGAVTYIFYLKAEHDGLLIFFNRQLQRRLYFDGPTVTYYTDDNDLVRVQYKKNDADPWKDLEYMFDNNAFKIINFKAGDIYQLETPKYAYITPMDHPSISSNVATPILPYVLITYFKED